MFSHMHGRFNYLNHHVLLASQPDMLTESRIRYGLAWVQELCCNGMGASHIGNGSFSGCSIAIELSANVPGML